MLRRRVIVNGGIVARPAEMRLTERAADYLAAGPADVVALIGHICQLPNPPRVVAEHMAAALFAGRTEFARDERGQWRLARHVAAHQRVSVSEPRSAYTRPDRAARLPPVDPLASTRRRVQPATAGAASEITVHDPLDLLASLS